MSVHLSKNRFAVRLQIIYNNLEIAYSSELRLLGTDIIENLKWNTHIQSLCSKLSKPSFIHSFISNLSEDRSTVSSKTLPPFNAI